MNLPQVDSSSSNDSFSDFPHHELRKIVKDFLEKIEKTGNLQIDLVDNIRLTAMQISKKLSSPSLNNLAKDICENHWKYYSSFLIKCGLETEPVQDSNEGKNHRLKIVNINPEKDSRWNLMMFFNFIEKSLEHGEIAGALVVFKKIEDHYLALILSEMDEIYKTTKNFKRNFIQELEKTLSKNKESHDVIALTALKAYVETLVDREEPKFNEILKEKVKEVGKLIYKLDN